MMVSYDTAKFGGYSHSGSGVIMILVCQVILQDHEIKDHVILCVGAPHGKSPHCQVCWS